MNNKDILRLLLKFNNNNKTKQMTSPENIYTCNIMQNEQVVLINSGINM